MSDPTDHPKASERTHVMSTVDSELPRRSQNGNDRIGTTRKWLARKKRSVEGWLKLNPITVLLLFPLVATPARFSRSQRSGVRASLIATGAFLWTAGDFWASAMKELASMSLRQLEAAHGPQMSEAAKQQFDLALGTMLGKPMILTIAAFIFVVGLCRATWYKLFMALYYRSKGHRPIVGAHYFLVQSASRGLYFGILIYAFSFTINNWGWLEEPFNWIAQSSYILFPTIIIGLLQKRYFQHKARVDKQLYGSWLAELVSTAMSLVATVFLGCGLMWTLGLTIRYLGNSGAG